MAIEDHAKKRNFVIVKKYLDEGWSGTILARPALDELRIDASKKIWDAVLVYDPDRIARKYSYQSLVIDELEDIGIEVLFVTTPPAKTSEDKLLYGVKGLFAEYERARSAERFRLGKLRKAREGHVITSAAPYGYRYIPKFGNKNGHYVVNVDEAKVIKMMFEWVAYDGLSLYGVQKKLYKQCIMPPKGKSNAWPKSTVDRLIKNETYAGTTHYNKTVGVKPKKPKNNNRYKKVVKSSRRLKSRQDWVAISVPAIIDKQLFIKAQEQLKRNAKFQKGNRKREYLLTGIVKCTCGATRAGDGVREHSYYRCSLRVNKQPKPVNCGSEGVNSRVLDKVVWGKLVELVSNKEAMKKHVKKWMDENAGKKVIETERQDVSRQLAMIEAQEREYAKLIAKRLVEERVVSGELRALQAQKALLNDRVVTTRVKKAQLPPLDTVDKVCDAIKYSLQYAKPNDKKAYVQKLLHEVVVGERSRALVKGYLPLPEQMSENIQYGTISRDSRAAECG